MPQGQSPSPQQIARALAESAVLHVRPVGSGGGQLPQGRATTSDTRPGFGVHEPHGVGVTHASSSEGQLGAGQPSPQQIARALAATASWRVQRAVAAASIAPAGSALAAPTAGVAAPDASTSTPQPRAPTGATETGARFLAELSRQPADPVTPLPPRFTPLARAIAGNRPVTVRSGPATTRALSTVGKAAATVDNVIHLASPAAVMPPSPEVVAHELVHAARPSPIPRFFDDDHHSAEEDLARSTGQLMRAITPPSEAIEAVGARTRGTAGLAVSGGGGLGAGAGIFGLLGGAASTAPPSSSGNVIRRLTATASSATTASTPSAPAAPTPAAAPSAPPESPPDPSTQSSPESPTSGGSVGDETSIGILRRLLNDVDVSESQSVQFRSSMWSVLDGAPSPTASHVGSSITPSTNELIERIIEAVEERVVNELERRGRRYNPGVF